MELCIISYKPDKLFDIIRINYESSVKKYKARNL